MAHLDAIAERLEKDQASFSHRLQQWEEDTQKAAQLEKTITLDEVTRLLAPADRKQLVSQIDALAVAQRMSEIKIMLSEPKPWQNTQAASRTKGLTESEIRIEAKAPLDSDIFSFLEQMNSLPGKLTLSALEITPLNPSGEAKTIQPYNLQLKVSYQWIANKSLPQ
jgi:hypothetical protein